MSWRAALRPRFVLVATLALVPTACTRCGAGGSEGDSTEPASSSASTASSALSASSASDSGSASALAPARCIAIGAPAPFGGGDGAGAGAGQEAIPFAAEIGGAASDERGFLVGVRASGLSGARTVLRIGLDGGAATALASFAPVPGEARPPLIAARGGRIVVGALVLEGATRTLHLFELPDAGAPVALTDLSQAIDESEATSILVTKMGVSIAWDDADDAHERGRVRLITLDRRASPAATASAGSVASSAKGTKLAPPLDVISPASSDASWPLLVPNDDGSRAVLLWIADRPEQVDAADAASGEPSQLEAYHAIEATVIDLATGHALAPTRALTSATGHVQTFAAEWTASGLVIALRDDPRPTDGDGGAILGVRASIGGDGVVGEPIVTPLADEDVAPGVPFVVTLGATTFASYLASDGRSHLVPVSGGAASIEPALTGRRLVAARADRVLASRLLGAGLELTVARCAP